MLNLSKLLYYSGNFFYFKAIAIFRFINKKASLWYYGRKQWKEALIEFTKANKKPVVWLHAASLGEFEQGRPVLEALKRDYPNYAYVVSFFSPSGYTIQKNYEQADFVCYLPINTRSNANFFITQLNPKLVLWVKYDFWSEFIFTLQEKNIPTILFSAAFRANQPFFKWYGKYWKIIINAYTYIFVQNQESILLLKSIGIKAVLANDTRFDRVLAVANQSFSNTIIETFIDNQPCLVAGSTWLEDEEEICHYANKNLNIKFIIAPHNIGNDRVKEIEKIFKNTTRYSQFSKNSSANVLILDTIGILSYVYRYATIAYVGGGFGSDGVHNTIEPAVYGKPMLWGPSFDKYKEAVGLIENGAAWSIETATEFEEDCDELFNDENLRTEMAENALQFIENNTGGTTTILEFMKRNGVLPIP